MLCVERTYEIDQLAKIFTHISCEALLDLHQHTRRHVGDEFAVYPDSIVQHIKHIFDGPRFSERLNGVHDVVEAVEVLGHLLLVAAASVHHQVEDGVLEWDVSNLNLALWKDIGANDIWCG